MSTVKLTKKLIDAAKTTGKRYYLWDNETRGLGVRVAPSGRKAFVLSYRTKDGTKRQPAVGTYGSITLEQARELAKDMIAEVRGGGDPSRSRKEARLAPTINDLLDRFEVEHFTRLKKKTKQDYGDIIKRYLRPRAGQIRVEAFELPDAQNLHQALSETPRMANLTLAVMSSALSFAERIGWRPVRSNPCPGVQRFPARKVHRPMSELEIARLAKVLREAETATPPEVAENPRAVAALRLLLFTGMRRNEALRLRWEEVDLEGNRLRLADSKTGEKLVRLNSAAREVIEAQEPMLGNPFVFPSPVKPGAPLYDVKGVWTRIRTRARLGDVRLHDLRHNYAATGAADGLSLHQLGQLLGHKDPSTTARYSDLTDSPAQRAAERVGQALSKAMKAEVEEA